MSTEGQVYISFSKIMMLLVLFEFRRLFPLLIWAIAVMNMTVRGTTALKKLRTTEGSEF
jgi:hypothetical protein